MIYVWNSFGPQLYFRIFGPRPYQAPQNEQNLVQVSENTCVVQMSTSSFVGMLL